MAINVSGSKTLTKLSLGSSLTVDISHNYNLFQIYDPNTNAFAPDWSATDTPLNLKAIAYYNGKEITSEATYGWTSCYDSSSEVSSVGTDKELAINTNVLQGHTSITYTVKVTYNKLTTANDITFTLINAGKDGQNGGEAAEHFVSISGEQIFKYDKDNKVSPASITLTATTKNVTVAKWYYLNGEESTDLNNDNNTTIIINPADACFIGNQALIKVTTNYTDVFDIYNLAKLYDGTNGTDGSTVTVTQKEGITTITTTDSDGNSTSVDVKDGEDGTPGSQGADGKTPFFHIKYSNDGGETFTDNNGETAGDYIGQYTDYEATDSSNVGAYTWSKIKGEKGDDGKSPSISISKAEGSTETIITTKNIDGTETSVTVKDGEKGTPGAAGDDGKTPFIHVKYSADGKTLTPATDTAALGETPSDWLGQYTDYTEDDSEEFSDYKWTKIKGENGTPAIQYYNWVKYANSVTPTKDEMYDTPTDTSGNYYSYIGLAYNKDTSTESGNYEDYKWTKIKGDDGDTYYTWIVYAKDADGKEISATWSDGYEYMAIKYNQKVSTPDLTAKGYVWKKFIGDNGVSSYFWTLYADDNKGTNTSSTYQTGYNYIGTCITTTNEAPATSKYSWVKFIGDDGASSYIHYAYAKDDKGNSFSTTFFEDATYIGVYKSTEEKDSDTYSDYKWKKFVGEDAPDITATKNTDGSVTLKIGDEEIGIDKGKDGTAMQTFYRYANSIPVSDADLQDTSKVSESPSYTDNGTIKYYSYIGQAIATATAGADITAPTSLSAWKWSYFKGEKGDDGSDAYSAILSNMNMSFRVDKNNKAVSAIKETCDVTVYKGTSSVAFTLGNLPDGITSPAESNSNNSRTLTISIAKGTLLAASGTFTIPISEPIVTNLEIKWTTVKDGESGVSITKVENFYMATDSDTTVPLIASTDWKENPSEAKTNESTPYLWNYEKITYSNGTTSDTVPAVIGNFAKDGDNAISISSVTEYYQITKSSESTSIDKNKWSTEAGTPTEGEYLWNYEEIKYEKDGEVIENKTKTTDPVVIGYVGKNGNDGRGISSITNYYCLSDAKTMDTPILPSTDWTTSFSIPTIDCPYLWNCEYIVYTDGKNPLTTKPAIISSYAQDGKSIKSITEKYVKTSNTIAPTESSSWSTDIPVLSNGEYLWKQETITYEQTGKPDDSITTSPVMIGYSGVDGKSITGVINYYLASANGSGIVKDGNTWYTDPSKTDWNATNKYLWNYEEITYSIGNSSETSPCIIGTYAADGKGISSITEEYAISAKAEEPAESEWNSEYLQPTDDKPFVWNKQTIKYTTGDPTVTSRIVCVKGVDGVNGGRWYSGTVINGGAGTTQIYTSSGIESAVIGDMYFNTSTNDTYRCTTAGDASIAKWTYVANIKGKQGDPGNDGEDAYYADIYSTDTVFSTSVTTLTFKANLYKGATTLTPSSCTWKINDEEITSTSNENNAYLSNNELIVKSTYISYSATVTCIVTTTVGEKTISRTASVQITDKTDVENLEERVGIVVDKDKKLNLNFNFNNDTSSSLSTSGIQLVGDQGIFRVDSTQLGFFAKNEDNTIGELLLGFGKKEDGSNKSDKLYVKGEVEAEKFIATTTDESANTTLTFGVNGGTMSFSKKIGTADAEKLLWYENGNLCIKGAITASNLKITGGAIEYFNQQAKTALKEDLTIINSSISNPNLIEGSKDFSTEYFSLPSDCARITEDDARTKGFKIVVYDVANIKDLDTEQWYQFQNKLTSYECKKLCGSSFTYSCWLKNPSNANGWASSAIRFYNKNQEIIAQYSLIEQEITANSPWAQYKITVPQTFWNDINIDEIESWYIYFLTWSPTNSHATDYPDAWIIELTEPKLEIGSMVTEGAYTLIDNDGISLLSNTVKSIDDATGKITEKTNHISINEDKVILSSTVVDNTSSMNSYIELNSSNIRIGGSNSGTAIITTQGLDIYAKGAANASASFQEKGVQLGAYYIWEPSVGGMAFSYQKVGE